MKNNKITYPDFSNLNYDGDYAIANFLSCYGKKNLILKSEEYPTSFQNALGISDCRTFHYKMISDGYLSQSTVADHLETEGLDKLVQIADELGYSHVGTEEELRARLALNVSIERLQKFIPLSDTYSLSLKGKEFLEKNHDLVQLYEDCDVYHIQYKEYQEQKELHPKDNYDKLLWDTINARFGKYIDENDYTAAQAEYLNMYALFMNEEKKPEALEALLTYFNMAINAFAQTMNCISDFKKTDEKVGPYLDHCKLPQVNIDQQYIEKIHALKDYFDPKCLKRIDQNDSNFYVKSVDFSKMVQEIFDGTFQLEETEEQLNGTIKSKLDHILRNEK